MRRRGVHSLGAVSAASAPVRIDQFDAAFVYVEAGASETTFHLEAQYEDDGSLEWARMGKGTFSLDSNAKEVFPLSITYDAALGVSEDTVVDRQPMQYTPGVVRVVKDSGPDMNVWVEGVRLR